MEEHTQQDLDGQQVVELLDTQAFFELLKLPYPTDRAGVLDRLVTERSIDATGGSFAIRRIGALLLAKRLTGFSMISHQRRRVWWCITEPRSWQTNLTRPARKASPWDFKVHVVHRGPTAAE